MIPRRCARCGGNAVPRLLAPYRRHEYCETCETARYNEGAALVWRSAAEALTLAREKIQRLGAAADSPALQSLSQHLYEEEERARETAHALAPPELRKAWRKKVS
jgi:hypothetical protein